ncbi:VWA domain-containing protein [Deinococcus sp.]|uniref:VWA domain-containing protein n=1 Tax=Deinococcus sp. TaxID=47478 RepID=UPI003B58DD9C
MTFIWPWALLLLLLLPLLIWGYARGLPRRARAAAIHPDLALLARAQGRPRPLRRHLPAALYLAAVGLGLLAISRPQAALPLPDNTTAIMLVLDVSRSMRADDIKPSRFEAAQEAARTFIKSLPAGSRVGLASFAGSSQVDVPPTDRHEQVLEAIDGLTLASRTAIGEGLLAGLQALPERDTETVAAATAPAPPGRSLPPAAIVLLSDGRSNFGVDPLEVAAQAKLQAVKVYTVGLGTATGPLPGSGFNSFYGSLDVETLQQIAGTTGGRYYEARSAQQLSSVYREMGRTLAWKVERREVSGIVSALAALLLLVSLGLSERFSRRLQ